MVFHIITLFPEAFGSYLKESIIGCALGKANQRGSKRRLTLIKANKHKLISVKFYNPRDFVKNAKGKDKNYRQVDDRPYGGGPGMVMRAEPILKAVEFVFKKISTPSCKRATPLEGNKKILTVNFVPNAEKFTTSFAKKVSKKYTDIILICGRYEGIDARVDKILKDLPRLGGARKISVGDYVLTGGELPAMVLMDCISRQIPGVLGKYESLEENRISSSEVYTRPEVLKYKGKKYKVPNILLSGNHKKIEDWKKSNKKS